MDINEGIAQEALKFLENAEKLEESGNLEEAIEYYQNAAEYLKRSGYSLTRINDIYERVQKLKDYISKDKSIRKAQLNAELEQLQERAFSLLDAANKFEITGQFNESIIQYNSAINLLVNAGWSDMQLENLREKVRTLSHKIAESQALNEQISKEVDNIQPEVSQAQVVGAFGKKKDATKSEELRKFTEARAKEEKVQEDAFQFIDNARFFEQDRKYGKAIESYKNAVELLNSIGWREQTNQLESIIAKLEIDKRDYESYQQSKKLESGGIEYSEDKSQEKEEEFQKSVQELEKLRLNEEKVQSQAFNLIDEGKRLEKEQKFDDALKVFYNAIELFNSIGWDSYIQPVKNLIKDIEERIAQEKKHSVLKEKRDDELKKIQDAIYLKERDEAQKTTREMEEKMLELQAKRKEEQRKEKQFLDLLDRADDLLRKQKDFEGSISRYQEALSFINDLGQGWESYKNTINTTIKNIKKLKEEQLMREIEAKKKIEQRQKSDIEFQKQMDDLLNRERARLKKEEVSIQEKEVIIKKKEENKNLAFKILEEAQEYVRSGELDNAIISYQKVASIFAEIQWADEIQIIEDSIKELQKKKEELRKQKKEEMERSIQKLKEEQDFQEQITKQLELERKKIREKEISIKLKEREKTIQEQRKKEVFMILEEAQSLVIQGQFDNAIGKYNEVVKTMAEIHWHDEIALIQNSILEIERKKRDLQIQKEKDLREKLQREQDEQVFQNQLITQMRIQQENLKTRQLVVREKEKELAHREKLKEKAYDLLNKAQEYISITKFDEAVELYREVTKIFAQIQWKDEIPLIQQSIQEIKRKKVEKEEWKQKTIQDAIKRENASKQFIEQIKRQREIEQKKIQKELELLEEKKLHDSQNIKMQETALKKIEEADLSIQQEDFDSAIKNYENSIKILEEIGWTGGYVKLLQDTLETIHIKKTEKESEKAKREKLMLEKQKSEEEFQKKLKARMEEEQKRLKTKEIEVKKKEEEKVHVENQKSRAFKVLDNAENLLNQRKYEDSISLYREAELILTEIGFPTDIIREMIRKIEVQKKQADLAKISETEKIAQQEEEDAKFQEKIENLMKEESKKLREKKILLEEKEKRQRLFEQRKQEAFKILNNAEMKVIEGDYENALNQYRKAELILNEIQFPTALIKDVIKDLQTRKTQEEIFKQKQFELRLKKQKEEILFQNRISEEIRKEKRVLEEKAQILEKKEERTKIQEMLQNNAFKLLDTAQERANTGDLDSAIGYYNEVISIFENIGWTDEVPLLKNSIRALDMKKIEQEKAKQSMMQQKLKIEEENQEFNKKIAEQSKLERERILKQQIELREKEDEIKFREERKNEAFTIIDQANLMLEQGKFEEARKLYFQVENIFAEIQWIDEIEIIHNSILEIERKKWDSLVRKQQEMQEDLHFEKLVQDFQNQITQQTQLEQEKLKKRDLSLKERDKELALRENERIEAFKLLDKANELIESKNYEEAIEIYHDVSRKFARIGWMDEIPLINQAIHDAETKRNEIEILRQKEREEAIRKEKERLDFIKTIKYEREREELDLKQQRERAQELLKSKKMGEEREIIAFGKIEKADSLLKQEEFDNAIEMYGQAREVLIQIGWTGSYLSLIDQSIQFAKQKSKEAENRKLKEQEMNRKQAIEQKIFEEKLREQSLAEQERLKKKQFEIHKKEATYKLMEERREEAFKIMNEAELMLNKGNYEASLEKYNEAELILSEINFPTEAVEEMIQKIRSKIQERIVNKQKTLELQIKQEEESKRFQRKISEELQRKEEMLKTKQIQLKKQEELREYMEKRKQEAFRLLDSAENFMKGNAYDKALEFYRSAEVILNEIQYPTNTILEMIEKVANMQRKRELAVFNDLEKKLQKSQEDRVFQQKLAEETQREKQKLASKQIEIQKIAFKKAEIEKTKERAFTILDQAKPLIEKGEFDAAIELYRKAILILKEIQFPTGALDDVIRKIIIQKREKEEAEDLEYQHKIEAFKREKQMEVMIQERKRQEREEATARQVALQERERLVQEQISFRDAAYTLLEEASKHLKKHIPDYDRAISLYIQARNILSEKIGWQPEINNINMLIKDLEKEKAGYVERRRLEKELELKRQKEYEKFQEEVKKRKEEYEKQKARQEQKLRELQITRQRSDIIKEEGLSLIDKGKENVLNRDFQEAYDAFNNAIAKFTQIGWTEQTKYIETEIENSKKLEEKFVNERLKLKKIHENLLKKKQEDKNLSQKREKELRSTVSDVSSLANEISDVIQLKKLEIEKQEKERKEKIKQDAKDYRKSMAEMIKLKQELTEEMRKTDEMMKEEKKKYKTTKDKEKAEEIKKMLKDISKNKKD